MIAEGADFRVSRSTRMRKKRNNVSLDYNGLWSGKSEWDRMVAGAKVVRCRVVDVVVGRKLHIDSQVLSKEALLRAAPHYE